MINECHRDRSCDRAVARSFAVYADPPTVLHLSGELDVNGAATFAAALEPLIARRGVILLDLADLTFMDSTGINALCQAAQRLGQRGRIILLQPKPSVRRVIEIAGLDGVLEINDEAPSG